jgi:hypothetical protein
MIGPGVERVSTRHAEGVRHKDLAFRAATSRSGLPQKEGTGT